MPQDNDIFKIDIHTHILPEKWPDLRERYGYGGFIRLEHHKPCCARMMMDDKFFREIESNCWDPVTRMHECDNHKVNVQVLSTVPVMFAYWAKPQHAHDLSMMLNDHIAGIVRDYPDRFLGLGSLPLQDPELSVKELERCVTELGLPGVQIGTHVNQWNLNAPELFPVFEAAADLGAAVFVHPWDMMGKEEMNRYWLPWLVGMPAETSRSICSVIFGGVLERLPELRMAFAHGGGAFPSTVGRVEHGFKVRPDLCAIDNDVNPRSYLGKIYFDSLVHDDMMLEYLVTLAGRECVALGSDYPFPLGEHHPGSLISSSKFDRGTKEWLLHKSAAKWLGLSREQLKKIGLSAAVSA
ncbi:MAG: amidohydrolase family protein [Bacteroidia bacterium]